MLLIEPGGILFLGGNVERCTQQFEANIKQRLKIYGLISI
jgi:hypothetical protein